MVARTFFFPITVGLHWLTTTLVSSADDKAELAASKRCGGDDAIEIDYLGLSNSTRDNTLGNEKLGIPIETLTGLPGEMEVTSLEFRSAWTEKRWQT